MNVAWTLLLLEHTCLKIMALFTLLCRTLTCSLVPLHYLSSALPQCNLYWIVISFTWITDCFYRLVNHFFPAKNPQTWKMLLMISFWSQKGFISFPGQACCALHFQFPNLFFLRDEIKKKSFLSWYSWHFRNALVQTRSQVVNVIKTSIFTKCKLKGANNMNIYIY